jgi:16S rRNA (guanine527-N7)-methyltransferase
VSLEQSIASGLEAMSIPAIPEQHRRLAAHLELIAKWNRVHNLTAVRETEQMVMLHVLDSLSLLPHLGQARTLLDVGSGPGFPGIPISIVRPEMQVRLLDSSNKKCAFLEQARAELGLGNVRVVCERVEAWKPGERFDLVISRAFADLSDFVGQAGHLVAPGGRMLAMKGVYPFEEIARVPSTHRVAGVTELAVPMLEGKRHLVALEVA